MTEFINRNDAGNIDFAERIADLEAAPPAPESFDAVAALQRVMGVVDRVAADPGNKTDELWVYAIRNAIKQR